MFSLNAIFRFVIDEDRKMSMLEFLLYKYSHTPAELLSRPQNGMTDELTAAYAKLEEANAYLADLEGQKAALEELAAG